MNRAKILLIATVTAIVLFVGLIIAQRKISNYTPMANVVYCIKDVKATDELDSSSFIMKDVPLTQVNQYSVRSLNDIKHMYAKEPIYANEVLNKQRIGNTADSNSYELKQGEVMISLGFQNFDDAVGGTVRKDDIVDIMFTSAASPTNSKTTTRTLIENVRVIDARTAAGKAVEPTDKDTPANSIQLAVKAEDAYLIENRKNAGKIKLIKKSNKDGVYNPIVVEDGTVISK